MENFSKKSFRDLGRIVYKPKHDMSHFDKNLYVLTTRQYFVKRDTVGVFSPETASGDGFFC